MRILLVMDPGILVPPKGYGGIERMVEVFAQEYVKLGHDVHLFVTAGSHVDGCTIHAFGKEGFPQKKSDEVFAIPKAWKFLWKHRNDFDLIHNFGRLAYLLPILNHPVRKIMTYQREINRKNIRIVERLKVKNLVFTACSANLLSRLDTHTHWEVVHNAIDFSKYDLQPNFRDDAPLIFLGRIERVKGCHTAIAVAKATGNKLIIAGNISPLADEKAYYENEIKPFIDGDQIKYVGALNDIQKNEWLGKSKAMLFPIEWNEPFGIVMIEAMACGTPVIAFNRGSVHEVIDEGITGFKVNNQLEMQSAVMNLKQINRTTCRKIGVERFALDIITQKYIRISDPKRKKILIVTTGQPAANPRVLKEYDAFVRKGYYTRVLYTYSANWSYEIDQEKFKLGLLKKQDFILVGGNPYNHRIKYLFSRVMFKFFKKIATILPNQFFREMSIARSAFSLWIVAKRYRADIYAAHYLGALPGAYRAAKKYKSVFTFDAEDFHRGEEPYFINQIKQVEQIEDNYLPKVNYLTTASPLISRAYKKIYPSIPIYTINNVFSKQHLKNYNRNNSDTLQLFWFSQYVGPKRGLENIIAALNILNSKKVSLHILGNIKNPVYVKGLINQYHFPEQIHFIKPVPPDEVFSIAAQFDIGLAAELPHCVNRDICLTNKIFTYLMAGNCVLASNTSAQRYFMDQHPGIGLVYELDDPNDLAAKIELFFMDRNYLNACKTASSKLAAEQMNWEEESNNLIHIVESQTENLEAFSAVEAFQ